MKLVIGLVGEKGSGKETFGNLLQELLPQKTVKRIRFSDVLGDTLDLWDIPKTRENLQDLAVIMKNQFGDDTLSHAIYKRIEKLIADIIIIDGVRWKTDVELIRMFPKNKLVYITADLNTRYERLKKRAEKRSENNLSFAQFMKEENKENELLIPKIGKKAEFRIINSGSLDDLKRQVETFIQKYI